MSKKLTVNDLYKAIKFIAPEYSYVLCLLYYHSFKAANAAGMIGCSVTEICGAHTLGIAQLGKFLSQEFLVEPIENKQLLSAAYKMQIEDTKKAT